MLQKIEVWNVCDLDTFLKEKGVICEFATDN